jgi:3',5'-cyclic AMP phosphodiesterase CpdA
VTSLAVVIVAACSDSSRSPTAPSITPDTPISGNLPPPSPPPPQTPPFNPTGATTQVVAVGDIGMCAERAAVARTAALVDQFPGNLILAGDLAYMHGTIQNFLDCFDPSWGKFRGRWNPVPGNHEYETPFAAGYRQYFAGTLGPSGMTFYSFRTGDWLVLMLDSNISTRIGSEQYEFVRATLRGARPLCTMAVWHHPLFSSGPNGPNTFMREMWTLLYEADADVVISGHDHLYERFGKQDVDGRSDPRGLRQFIVGTGGAQLYEFQRQEPNSQARRRAHGVLRLTLMPSSYQWSFVDITGAILDAGTDGCH